MAAAAAAAAAAAGGVAPLAAPAVAAPLSVEEREVRPGVWEGYWEWEGHRIRYQRCGGEGPPVLCVHG